MAGPYSTTVPLVRGKVVRFTQEDQCGMPLATKGTYTTSGFVQVTAAKNYDAGQEIKVAQANGLIGVHVNGRMTFLNMSLTVQLIKVNPGVITMLTGDAGVLDFNSTLVGWEENELRSLTSNFGMEVWTASSAVKCSAGSLVSGYLVYPGIEQITMDVDSVTEKECTVTLKGLTFGNPSWGLGPYGGTGSIPGPVAADAINTPSRLLQPVAAGSHRHFEITPIAPPVDSPVDGPQTYTLPSPY